MSKKLKQSLQPPEDYTVYCLSKDDWDKLAASLLVAEELFKQAEVVTSQEWADWTADFSEGEGFPSIIYHDKPVMIRPPTLPLTVDK